MKPGDHPEFFRFPAPAGRSRESTIAIDKSGKFFHDGEPVEKRSMTVAFSKWLRRHPDDGRYILSNGYDWTYITVEDAPFTVVSLNLTYDGHGGVTSATVVLSDESEESLDAASLTVSEDDVVYVDVKSGAFEARFSPQAQSALGPLLHEGSGGKISVLVDGVQHPISRR